MNKLYFDKIISIGQDCSVGEGLRQLKFKEASYPFDWSITSLEFIKDSFFTKFNNFNNILTDCVKTINNKIKLKNNSVYFYHDILYSELNNKTKNIMINKYIKRSQRLHNLLIEYSKNNKSILFIRKSPFDTYDNINDLKIIIMNNYPNLNFKILLINNVKNENIINDDNILYEYLSEENFVYDLKNNDIYGYIDQKIAYNNIKNIINKFNSEKYVQPLKRDEINN